MIFTKDIKTKIIALGLLPAFLFLLSPSKIPVDATGSSVRGIMFALNSKSELNQISTDYSLSSVKTVFDENGLPPTYKAQVRDEQFARMLGDSRFSYVEPDSSVKVSSAVLTNDPYFTNDLIEDKQWYLPKVKIPDAWNYAQGSSQVKVAIIDTGIHSSHLDLNDGRVIAGQNIVTGSSIPANSNSDDNGHGTAVAGVIGAIPNNSKGLTGINWNVSLMPVKALAADGTGEISTIAAAIVWAADNGANIINMSLGGPGFGNDQTLNNSIIYAYNKGVLIVAAGGNDLADQGLNLDTNPVYPVCSDAGSNMVIGVAATDINDRKASFSNFSINCIDITAPGKKILTTAYLPSEPSNNILIYGSGTSLATPVVSGVAALIKSRYPNMSNTEIRNLMLKTADNIDPLNQNNCLASSCNGFLGKGRINALSALQPQPLVDGSLIRETASNKVYMVSGGTKRYVSDFVFQQLKYQPSQVLAEVDNQLANLTTGLAVPPLEGTLIKSQSDATVYVIHQQLKRPLTYLVFLSRKYSFANVKTMPDADVAILQTGDWYWPPEGTLVLIKGDPTVYVMYQELARPTTYFVFIQRKLSFSKVVPVSLDEFSHVPKATDPYWLPPIEGTLVKGVSDPTVFVIENGTKRGLSGEAFTARGYKFSSIKTLPDAEMVVIAPGSAILN